MVIYYCFCLTAQLAMTLRTCDRKHVNSKIRISQNYRKAHVIYYIDELKLIVSTWKTFTDNDDFGNLEIKLLIEE